jgi:hypothetical protein
MGLLSSGDAPPVATVETVIYDGDRVIVNAWVDEAARQESSYHALLLFLMSYERLLLFLGYRDAGEELVGWMDDAVRALAAAPQGERVSISGRWTLVETAEGEPRSIWSSALRQVGPGAYRVKVDRPKDPVDADAQAAVLCHMQKLADTLPALERAYLAIAVSGMHEYYSDVKHWGNAKSLKHAVDHGMKQARRVLEKR